MAVHHPGPCHGTRVGVGVWGPCSQAAPCCGQRQGHPCPPGAATRLWPCQPGPVLTPVAPQPQACAPRPEHLPQAASAFVCALGSATLGLGLSSLPSRDGLCCANRCAASGAPPGAPRSLRAGQIDLWPRHSGTPGARPVSRPPPVPRPCVPPGPWRRTSCFWTRPL